MTELEIKVDILEKKVKVLEDLEKRLALAVIDVMPSTVRNVSGYDIGTVRTAMGVRWVWKHFLRGTRSAATFETREACVKSAQADSLKNLAFPTNDIANMVNKEIERERSPHPHRLDAFLPNAKTSGFLRTRRS